MPRPPGGSSNTVTNAQLAAWIQVVPSTIQAWRRQKDPGLPSDIMRKAVRKHLSPIFQEMVKTLSPSMLVRELEQAYLRAGSPKAGVTGRDFTDPGRINPINNRPNP